MTTDAGTRGSAVGLTGRGMRAGIIGALWFLVLVNYLDRVAISFAGPAMMSSLGISPAGFGLILAAFGVGYILGQAPGGALADRFGTRRLLMFGPILWAALTGATGLAATLAGFLAVRILFGISEGLTNTSVYKTIGDHFEPARRSRALAICVTSVVLAPALAGPLVVHLVTSLGWRAMFYLMAAPALVAAGLCAMLIPAGTGADAPASTIPWSALLRDRSTWLLSLAAFAWNIPYWGFLGWMPSYLALGRHLDLKTVGPLGGLIYVFGFVGMLIGGWFGSSRGGRYAPQFVATAFVLAGASLILAYRASDLTVSLAGLSGAAFFLFSIQGPVGHIALELAPPAARARFVGIYNTTGQVGTVVAPGTIGFLVNATGTFAGGFGFMIGGLCLSAVCVLALAPRLAHVRATAAALA